MSAGVVKGAAMGRRGLAIGAAVGAGLVAAAVAVLTPWRPLGRPADVRPDVAASFSPDEVHRAATFRADLGPWPFVALALTVAVPWAVLFLLSRRARRSGAATPGAPRRRWLVVLVTVLAVVVLQWLVSLPFAVHAETVLRRYGLSTQTWPGWLRDELVGLGIGAGITALGVLAVWFVVRRAPRRWPWVLAGGAAVLTVVGSVLYPLVIEPVYNRFTALPQSPLTRSISAMAARDGIAHVRVVVSDASSRTTGENAHVSGLGSTRWVVLDDTTLARAHQDPAAVLAVVAHEFGHVRHQDVLRGTTLGAVGAATGVLLLSWGLTSARGRRWFVTNSPGRGDLVRGTVLLLAVATTAPWVAAPVTNLVSRQIEASADVHSLDVTGDVPAFERMQHDLAVSNLSRLQPTWWQTVFFATHPDPAWRIAQARSWQELHR